MLRITGHDGTIVQVSSWSAWRRVVSWRSRRRCTRCDGSGKQWWMIEASAGMPTRWFPDACRSCGGRGWHE